MKYKIYNQDVIEWAHEYQKGKFHALISDTPYHLQSIVKRFGKKDSAPAKHGTDGVFSRSSKGFMGQTWDGGDIAFRPETWEALGEHLYPGAFGMCFSASRNWHRLAVAIEDAGFIIHPTIFGWLNGQGFPKATNISKQIQPASEQKVVGVKHNTYDGANRNPNNHKSPAETSNIGKWGLNETPHGKPELEPTDEMAIRWNGHRYGLQALKPAVEPIIVFQKPYEGKPLENIVRTGAGAINIEGGRIPTQDDYVINQFDDGMKPFGNGAGHKYKSLRRNARGGDNGLSGTSTFKIRERHAEDFPEPSGRWPANFILDESVAGRLDEQSGTRTSGKMYSTSKRSTDGSPNGIYGKFDIDHPLQETIGDSGGASRFFYNVQEQIDAADPIYYCGKVSPTERNAGLDDRCIHPTMKPIALAKYLATLLLPPDEYAPRRILVPFSGVGSELIGCALAGWEQIVGIEFDTENGYVDMAHKRMEYWSSK